MAVPSNPGVPAADAVSDPTTRPVGLRRSLSVWQAVGLSVALMAPSMAANINPQATASSVGRAVPLAFLLSAVGVLLVAYVFVRLCQHFQHAGSVYAFVGATLGARAGVVAGWGLLGTYTFYGVVTSSAAGIFGTAFLQKIDVWPHPPTWGPFVLAFVALALAWLLTVMPAKRGTSVLLTVEGLTVALILVVTVVVLVRLLSGTAPGDRHATLSVFTVPPGTGGSAVFLGAVFGFLSFAGFEAAATLGEEAAHPRRDIPRAILGTAIFGGVYFVVVTAVEVMGFGADQSGVARFTSSPSLLGDLGSTYVGAWVGDVITVGAAVSAFGCCLACVVGGSRLLYALARDTAGRRGIGEVSGNGTPATSAAIIVVAMAAIIGVCVAFFSAKPTDTFAWSGTIGTLMVLVVYVLTTLGAIWLLFVRRLMRVPGWQVIIPLAALAVLGYTLYRNVIPYPASGPARWFPVVGGIWLLVAVLAVLALPGMARRLGARLTADGLAPPEGRPGDPPRLFTQRDTDDADDAGQPAAGGGVAGGGVAASD
ncbi:amino acid permease [Rugosimonospora acidiphila]|uniref:Amino acid permease n=1 Tax=Rugosimonospora acidiphila TaxID=556531 RepID=A0ABP9S626_9ACTN